MRSSYAVQHVSWSPVRCLLSVACLFATTALAAGSTPVAPAPPPPWGQRAVNDVCDRIATHTTQIDNLLEVRADLSAQLAQVSSLLEEARERNDKNAANLKEQQAQLTQKVANKDTELQTAVSSQAQLLATAQEQRKKLEKLENKKRFFRFVTGAGVMLHRLPDLQLGPGGIGASPGSGSQNPEPARLELDVYGGVAFLPVDLNSRDGGQAFSLGGMVGLGGHGFPANLYTGLTFKAWLLYLNAGLNFQKSDGGRPWTVTQPLSWEGGWTPTLFAGLSLDVEELLGLQKVLPSKSSPEGLKVEPR